jgi:hypothetical protein
MARLNRMPEDGPQLLWLGPAWIAQVDLVVLAAIDVPMVSGKGCHLGHGRWLFGIRANVHDLHA